MEIISQGSDYKLSTLLTHIKLVSQKGIAIYDHETQENFWLPTVVFNRILRDFDLNTKLTYRLYRKKTNDGKLINCMDILHF